MIKKILTIVIGLSVSSVTMFAQQKSADEMPVDKQFVTGKLQNGLTYYIRKTDNQPNTADFYIVHNVGSLQEEPNQRGLAHFLEHMAFNGTKNFPGKNLLNSLTKNGVKFGVNVNAYTSQDRTVYHIASVPMKRDSFTDSVILMIHDWSSFISCEPDEVNAERGVILEEWRRGDDARSRMMSALIEMEQHGSRFAERRVIGLPEIIQSFTPKTLVDYYHKWYRPDLQAIIIVGDIDTKDMLSRVERIFADIPLVKDGAKRVEYPMPQKGDIYIGKYSDPELKASATRIIARYPSPDKAALASIDGLKQKLAGSLIADMLMVRGDEKSEKNVAGYKKLIPTVGETYYACNNFRIVATPKNNNLEKAYIGILQDYEQMRRYGFSKEELEDAKMSERAKYAKEAKKLAKPSNEDYVGAAVTAFTRNVPLYDIQGYYKMAAKAINEITPEYINDFIAKNLNYENLVVAFSGSGVAPLTYPSDERILFLVDSLKKAPSEPYNYVSKVQLQFKANLTPVELPAPKAVTFNGISDFVADVQQVDLPNGAKVLVVNNTGENQFIRMRAVRKGGFSTAPDSMVPAVRMLKGNASNFAAGGMEKNNFIRYQNNNGIGVMFDLDHNNDIWRGSFTKENIDQFFKILYVDVTSSVIKNKDLKPYKEALIKKLSEKISPEQEFKDSCNRVEYKPNLLLKRASLADTSFLTVKCMQEMFQSHFGDVSGFTFIFEGSGLEYSYLKPYIEKYLANLPAGTKVASNKLYDRAFRIKNGTSDLRYIAKDVTGDRTTVAIDMIAYMKYDKMNSIASKFLSNILRDRYIKTIREERGGSYHVGVTSSFYQKPEDYLVCTVDFETNPKMVDELIGCVWKEIKDIAKNGPDTKEVDNIKQFYYKIAAQQNKDYRQAVNIIFSQLDGEIYINNLEKESIDSVNAKMVQKIAKDLLKQKNIKTMIFEPEQK